MTFTLVAFHAHPDDEAILTGGTLARAAAAGHRVVLVTATDGALGLTSSRYAAADGLATVRAAELRESARLLGVARVEQWEYADSGLGPTLFPDPPGQVRFVRASVEEAAERLADLLAEESADLLIGYDVNGGYGHPDHVQVHRVGVLAARLAGTPRLVEAAVNPWVARLMKPRQVRLAPVAPVTVTVDVRDHIDAKVAAMRAHRSQLTSDSWLPRNLEVTTRLPGPVLRRLLGQERFADPSGSSEPLCP